MKAQDRRTYWRQNTRIQLKLQAKYSKRILKALQGGIDEIIGAYRQDPKRAVNTPSLWNNELLKVYNDLYRETVVLFAKIQYRRLAKMVKQTKSLDFEVRYSLTDSNPNQQWLLDVNEWLNKNGLQLVTTVTGSQKDKVLEIINQLLQEGVERGLGVDKVTSNIIAALKAYKGSTTLQFNAERIARTETMRASNIGHIKGAKAHNFVVVKEWISAVDNRIRRYEKGDDFDHWALDGQQREMWEMFTQQGMKSGKVASVTAPGGGEDNTAPAAFVINCRCTVAFEPKRDSQGRLIRKIK